MMDLVDCQIVIKTGFRSDAISVSSLGRLPIQGTLVQDLTGGFCSVESCQSMCGGLQAVIFH